MALRSPSLAAIEAEVSKGQGSDDDWFDVLSRYEPVRAWAGQLSEQDRLVVVRKFRLFRAFEKLLYAEFRLENIAAYLLTADGDVRGKASLPLLKALMAQATRKGRRTADFESVDRPTHRVDSTCYELRLEGTKDDEVDRTEMAFRRLFAMVDGTAADVRDVEQALTDLYALRSEGLLVENAAPQPTPQPEPQPAPQPAPEAEGAFAVVCPNPECGARLRIPAKHAGRRGRCPRCGHVFDLPQARGQRSSGNTTPSPRAADAS